MRYDISNERFEFAADTEGATILRFALRGGGEVLQSCEENEVSDKDATGGFPMLPLANRVRDNRYALKGKEVRLDDCPVPGGGYLHGYGWCSSWNIREIEKSRMLMTHSRRGSADGYDYEASLEFALTDEGLEIVLGVRHAGSEERLYGLGFHPYFVIDESSRLQISAAAYAPDGEGHLPGERSNDVPEEHDYARAKAVSDAFTNHGYAGFNGLRLFRDGMPEITLRSSGDRLMMYRRPKSRFVALEPQTHDVDGCNMTGRGGLRLLSRAFDRMELRVSIEVGRDVS